MTVENRVYKKCRDVVGNEFLVTLIKPEDGFISNELREDVVDPQFAKFRCNGLMVEKIVGLKTNTHFQNVFHCAGYACIRPVFFEYSVGNVAKPHFGFDSCLKEVCGSGIHYFLSEEAAVNYSFEHGCVWMDLYYYDKHGAKIKKSMFPN